MTCPKCRLINPPTAARCDCGYDLESGVMAASYLSPAQRAAAQPRRSVHLRAGANAFLATGLVAVVLLSLARLNGPRGTIGVVTYLLMAIAIGLLALGVLLLAFKRTRADAVLVVAAGLGTWSGLYLGLSLLL